MLDGLVDHPVLDAPLSQVPVLPGSPFSNRPGLVLVKRLHGRSDDQDLLFCHGDLFAFVHHHGDRVGLRFDEAL